MKILMFGHSYVNYLKDLGDWNREICLSSGERVDCQFLFRGYSGKDYQFLLNNPTEFRMIELVNPDIIVIVLGGNSISNNITNTEINDLALQFYTQLNTVVRPECLKLAVQVEPRFVQEGNRFGTPGPDEYNKRRTILNNFVNKKLKQKNHLIDNVVLLGSIEYLREAKYFTDGVHLTKEGLLRYKDALLGGITYALENRKK